MKMKMIEERIDKLIEMYQEYYEENCKIIEKNKENLKWKLNNGYEECAYSNAIAIKEMDSRNFLIKSFIESLEYAKIGETND